MAADVRVRDHRTGVSEQNSEVPRRFITVLALDRKVDASGVSGTGIVAYAVVFPGGKCVVDWQVAGKGLAIYDSFEAMVATHGHDGQTKFIEEEVVDLDA
jgi:hypothetical protein